MKEDLSDELRDFFDKLFDDERNIEDQFNNIKPEEITTSRVERDGMIIETSEYIKNGLSISKTKITPSSKVDKLDLKSQLTKAIQDDNFEEAIRIRDLINKK